MPRRTTPEPIAAKVGARLRDLRQERGFSLAALADASGLSKGHMSSVERGLVLVTVGTVVAAAKALGVPPFVVIMFPDEDPLAAALEHVREIEGGDSEKAAATLRKAVLAGGARSRRAAKSAPATRTRRKS
jgi:transcriptional regulator with XRE-family HTH domain